MYILPKTQNLKVFPVSMKASAELKLLFVPVTFGSPEESLQTVITWAKNDKQIVNVIKALRIFFWYR